VPEDDPLAILTDYPAGLRTHEKFSTRDPKFQAAHRYAAELPELAMQASLARHRECAVAPEDASAYRGHSCTILVGRTCVVNASVVYQPEANAQWTTPKAAARLPWNAHRTLQLAQAYGGVDARVLRMLGERPLQETGCRPPIAWVPCWSTNFGETFANSIVPLLELEIDGLSPRGTTYLPDVLSVHKRRGGPQDNCGGEACGRTAPAWFTSFVGELSGESVKFLEHVAPPCGRRSTGRGDQQSWPARCAAKATCYSHFRFCNFRSVFNGYPASMLSLSAAGQILAQRVFARHNWALPPSAATGVLRVLFERRIGPSRIILNANALLTQCIRAGHHECTIRSFGNSTLAEDIRAAREADVLVGMHGAGLTHAHFMRKGSALVEIRPFGFEGAWPDKYMRTQHAHGGNFVFHLHVAIGSPDLCYPRYSLDVGAWGARSASCAVPWPVLAQALENIKWFREDSARYERSTPAARMLVAYPPSRDSVPVESSGRHGTRTG
jgi:hypothetical protein